jgi:hypothetical protein
LKTSLDSAFIGGEEVKSDSQTIRFLIATTSPREFVEVALVIGGGEKKGQ